MNKRRYILCSLATGFIMVTLWAFLGFWGRWICWSALEESSSGRHGLATISPLGLLPEEIEYDPNVFVHSKVYLYMRGPSLCVSGLGIVNDLSRVLSRQGALDILHWERQADGTWTYLDRASGQIVHSYVCQASKSSPAERKWVYIGPKGTAESGSEAIGRFDDPVVGHMPGGLIVYDSKFQRFFKVLLSEPSNVIQGPVIERSDTHRPIQIMQIAKGQDSLYLEVEPPMRKVDPNKPGVLRNVRGRYRRSDTVPTVPLATGSWLDSCILVLNRSGRIDKLNPDTLELTGSAGSLPGVPELFTRSSTWPKPRNLSAFGVLSIQMFNGFSSTDSQSLGCAAFAANHDGSAVALAVYDNTGRQAASNTVWNVTPDVPGGMLATTIRFCLENAHPPALSLWSFLTASHYAGGTGYRSIFALPDSLIAKEGRDYHQLFAFRLMGALALIAPGIVLVLILSCLLARRARRIGMSKDARTLWIITTLAFGVPAYLTYRLTEPRMRLVTCRNCGKLRRPDMDRCHLCQSPWDVPELIAPAWRVLDGPQDEQSRPLSEPAEQESTEPDSTAE